MVDRTIATLRRPLPLALILFLPFLAIALAVLYLRGPHLFVDHLVFALHFQTASFCALSLWWLVALPLAPTPLWTVAGYVAAALAILFVYLPLALRHVYGHGRIRTALETVLLVFAYFQLLGLVSGPIVVLVLLST